MDIHKFWRLSSFNKSDKATIGIIRRDKKEIFNGTIKFYNDNMHWTVGISNFIKLEAGDLTMKSFNMDFKLVVIGQIISIFGSSILKFALSLYVLDLTGSAGAFATILAVSTIPIVVLAPIGGAIADRFNRKKLMVIFDFLSSAIVLAFLIILVGGNNSVLLIGVIMTLLSIISTMYQPTVQASLPVLVDCDNLIKANGVVAGIAALANIAGPIIGGLLYSFMGLKVIVIVSCISFFLSAVMEIFIYIPFVRQDQSGNIIHTIFSDIKDGLRYLIKGKPIILKIMLIAAGLNMLLVPMITVGVPYIVKITMGASSTLYGISQGAISFSMILAAASIGMVGKKLTMENLHRCFFVCGLFFVPMALSIYLFSASVGFWITFIVFTISGMLILFSATIASIFIITMIQKETPNNILGKVMAILFAGSTCATPVGQMIYGEMLDSFADNVYVVVIIAGIVTIMMAGIAKMLLKRGSTVT